MSDINDPKIAKSTFPMTKLIDLRQKIHLTESEKLTSLSLRGDRSFLTEETTSQIP